MSNKLTKDPQDELLIEVDSNNSIIGSIPRGVAHNSPDKIYRIVVIFVKNGNNYLWQKRSATKGMYPNCWSHSVGGHVGYGKDYAETAVKELKEELGIVASEKEFKFIGEVLVKFPTLNEFSHVFEYNLKPTDRIDIAKDEVSEVRWMSMDEAKESMRQQKLKWYHSPVQLVEALY